MSSGAGVGVAAAPGVVLGVGAAFLPESPRWLIARARAGEAEAVLGRLRPPDTAALEARAIADLAAAEASSDISGWSALRIPWVRAVLLVGIGIGIVQQVTGVNSIMYYGTQILSRSGLGIQGALVANVLNGVISVLATFIGIALVGRIGRRPMLVIGLIGTTSSLLLLGVVSLLFQPSHSLAYLVLGAMSPLLCFQQGFVSPVTWLLLSEIFPLKVRGLGMGAATLVLWGANFVVAFSFPQLVAGFGVSRIVLRLRGGAVLAPSLSPPATSRKPAGGRGGYRGAPAAALFARRRTFLSHRRSGPSPRGGVAGRGPRERARSCSPP